jgi:hypothetical protein
MKLITILNKIGFIIAIPMFVCVIPMLVCAIPLLIYLYIIKILLPSTSQKSGLHFPLTEDE